MTSKDLYDFYYFLKEIAVSLYWIGIIICIFGMVISLNLFFFHRRLAKVYSAMIRIAEALEGKKVPAQDDAPPESAPQKRKEG